MSPAFSENIRSLVLIGNSRLTALQRSSRRTTPDRGSVIVDFGLFEERMRPLRASNYLDPDPLTGVVAAYMLSPREVGSACDTLFGPVRTNIDCITFYFLHALALLPSRWMIDCHIDNIVHYSNDSLNESASSKGCAIDASPACNVIECVRDFAVAHVRETLCGKSRDNTS